MPAHRRRANRFRLGASADVSDPEFRDDASPATPAGQSFKSVGHVRCRVEMSLRLYNTRTRRKELFAPLSPGVVKMYVCGPTTYDYSHLGHARSYIDFDVARRYVELLGHRVSYVQNFTDIEEV